MFVTVGSALLTHMYFKRYEPQSPKHALSILLGIPSFLLLLAAHAGRTPASGLSTLEVLGTLATYFATLIGSIAAYRVSPFHPLSRYPGPFIAKLSKLWMVFICSTGKQHEYYAYLHKKYGDIVRSGPNEVVIRDPSVILPLMGTTGWGKSSHWVGRTLSAPIPPLIAIRDGPEHAKRRRTWNRGFNPTAMRQYEPMVHKKVLRLVEVIVQRGQVDLGEMLDYFALDAMTDMALGGGTDMIYEGDPEGLWHLIEAGMRTATLIGHIPWVGRYVKSLPGVGTDLKRFRAFAMQKFLIRKNEGSGHKDLFYHLADEAGIEKQPIPTPVALSDSGLVVVAGSDTTATVLSSLFFYLLRDQKKFERLRAEVDRFYPQGDQITTEHFGEMDYLEACINEALRLSPPVPSGSPRAALHPNPSRGKMLGPYYIPEGNSACINFLAIQRDPKNFYPFPNTFWPDRWLVAKGLIELPVSEGGFVHEASAFIPFSFGPGVCVGKPLALLELRMTTANLVRDLDLKFEPGYKETWESDWQDYFVITKGKLPIIATPRA
ncbi:cytochrome P450 [Thelephora ganbajun]|uniref:Cytochrome P450 n=1 Tax=Thelephora ganbajun TaxID=370292 RepID=A0ACB6Z5M3_THEGA|nr:cytochrome P450 [Thelephora ganbajun]